MNKRPIATAFAIAVLAVAGTGVAEAHTVQPAVPIAPEVQEAARIQAELGTGWSCWAEVNSVNGWDVAGAEVYCSR